MMVDGEGWMGWMEYLIRFLSIPAAGSVHFLRVVCRVLVRVGGNGGNVVQDGIQLNARYGK